MQIKKQIFFAIVFTSFIISIFVLISSHGVVLGNLVFGHGTDLFMDFFNHISYVSSEGWSRVYDQGYNANFPPLAYLLYGFISSVIPRGQTVMYNASQTGPYAMVAYALYCVVLSVLFFNSVRKICTNDRASLFITLAVILSNVFIFGVLERGNSSWIVCILLLQAICLRDSAKPIQRELALIFIATAASIKVYPAVFGLIYLIEKRWKESIRLILYGVSLFFLPFCLFGGLHGLRTFIANQIVLQDGATSVGNIRFLSRVVENRLPGNMSLYLLFFVAFVAICVLTLLNSRVRWKTYYILCALMILLPKWSANYTAFYMVIPLTVFLTKEEKSALDGVYAALFGCIFSLITFGSYLRITGYSITLQEAVIYGSIWLIVSLIIVEENIKHFRLRKGNNDVAQ